ncbi:MAG: hypothetical protein ACRCT6_09210 [Notoacmeibacter sp.]
MSENKETAGKVKVIGELLAKGLKLGLDFADGRVDRVLPDGTAEQKIADWAFDMARDIVEVLSDDNAANREQVRTVISLRLTRDLAPILQDLANEKLNEIGPDNIEDLAKYFTAAAFESAKILVDLDPDNKTQLSAFWGEWLMREETKDAILKRLIIETLESRWADKPDRLLLVKVLEELLDVAWDAIIKTRSVAQGKGLLLSQVHQTPEWAKCEKVFDEWAAKLNLAA